MHTSHLFLLTNELLRRIHNLRKEDILTLREVLPEHNRLYYQEQSPIISDYEYDQLFHALARLEADHDMITSDSPTNRLAILASEQFQKVQHRFPMISLDNTYNLAEIRDFEQRIRNSLKDRSPEILEYYLQPKFDGLGLAVVYEYGNLVQAITRGSGVEGEDVTLNAFEIENIPKKIDVLESVKRMEIRGEIMMRRSVFESVNRERLES